MKMPILEIRKQAKDALKGKWGKAIGAIFSEYGILYAASMVAVIIFYVIVFVGFFAFFAAGGFQQENLGASPFMIIFPIALVVIVYGLFFLIYAFLHPLTLGKNKWFYDNLKGIDQSVGTIFHFFKKGNGYFRAVKLLLWKILFIGLFTLLLIIPYAIFMLCFFSVRNNLFPTIDPLMTEIIGWVFLAIFIIAYFALIFFVERYALANYVAIEKSALKAKNCIDISVNMMKGRKISLILLSLSIYWPLFIPVPIFIAFAFLTYLSQLFMIGFLITYLLWFLCMFASMFYLLPWYEMAMAKFAIVTFSQENTPAENE